MQGILVPSAKLTPYGFELDWQWMLVTKNDSDWHIPWNRQYSLTRNVKVAEISVSIEVGYLWLSHPTKSNSVKIKIDDTIVDGKEKVKLVT